MKPTLLLDVDGVLNPIHPDGRSLLLDPPAGFEEAEDVKGLITAKLFFSPENVRRLDALAFRFDLVWCTGWEDQANDVVGPLHGLPKLRVIHFEHESLMLADLPEEVALLFLRAEMCWKLPWIAHWLDLNEVGPVVWVDDQIEPGDREWATWRTAQGQPTFLVRPFPEVGLTDENVRHALQWEAQVALGAVPPEPADL